MDIYKDEDVQAVVDEVSEELAGYIGQWLDEKPYFTATDAVKVLDQIRDGILGYLNVDLDDC